MKGVGDVILWVLVAIAVYLVWQKFSLLAAEAGDAKSQFDALSNYIASSPSLQLAGGIGKGIGDAVTGNVPANPADLGNFAAANADYVTSGSSAGYAAAVLAGSAGYAQ